MLPGEALPIESAVKVFEYYEKTWAQDGDSEGFKSLTIAIWIKLYIPKLVKECNVSDKNKPKLSKELTAFLNFIYNGKLPLKKKAQLSNNLSS